MLELYRVDRDTANLLLRARHLTLTLAPTLTRTLTLTRAPTLTRTLTCSGRAT